MSKQPWLCAAALLSTALLFHSGSPGPVSAKIVALTDNELDGIVVGADVCELFFGIKGPCIASALQLFNPQAPPQSQSVALPVSSNGTVTLSLHAASSSPDGSRSQIATQSNSLSTQGSLAGLSALRADLSTTSILVRTMPIVHP